MAPASALTILINIRIFSFKQIMHCPCIGSLSGVRIKIQTKILINLHQRRDGSDNSWEFKSFLGLSQALSLTFCVTQDEMLKISLHYCREGQRNSSPEYSVQK